MRTYRWAHEYFCLRHFAQTGHVPQILEVVPERLIVMTRFPSSGIEAETLNLHQKKQVSYEMGQVVADLVQWPLPTAVERLVFRSEFEQFAWRSDIGEILRHCLALCRQIQKVTPVYQTQFFTESLTLAEQHIDFIDQQPRILFHEDIANLCVHQGRFRGFYDLEMVRMGTEALQLGMVLSLCKPQWLDEDWLVWSSFLEGYQDTSGRTLDTADLRAILAMNHFHYHIRICRWGKWDGDPTQQGSRHFATSMAASALAQMKAACDALREWVDLEKWLPSLRG